MTTVLVALDGSAAGQAAAEAAAAVFGPDARYLAINVASEPGLDAFVWGNVYGFPYPPVIPANPEMVDPVESAEAAREVAAATAADAGVEPAAAIGAVGDPVEAIVRAARAHRADVIVAGWHPRGWFSRLIEESTTDALFAASDVPVLVVPLRDDD